MMEDLMVTIKNLREVVTSRCSKRVADEVSDMLINLENSLDIEDMAYIILDDIRMVLGEEEIDENIRDFLEELDYEVNALTA